MKTCTLTLLLPVIALTFFGVRPHAQAASDAQPLVAHARRLMEATELLGVPFSAANRKALEEAFRETDDAKAVEDIERVLDEHCLVKVNINPESRVKAARGPAKAELVQNGWRAFLVKVLNESGTTAELFAVSPNARALWSGGWDQSGPSVSDKFYGKQGAGKLTERELWLDLDWYTNQPLSSKLSGARTEYRLLQLYSRDAGSREARLSFHAGQGTQDLGFRSDVDLLFTCQPAREITLRVLDENDKPTTASFVIRDRFGRTYPAQFKRLAPDFWFHPQVYRADKEKIQLPDGEYTIECSRGPESMPQRQSLKVDGNSNLEFKIRRWIDPSTFGWWSGDHHIHAAGCAHYTKPTEGVHPPDMFRHIIGEDLKIGSALTWGPCFDYQKQFFSGKDDPVSQSPYLLHYDIEVSQFGSHESGHMVLLSLKEQIYPGGTSKNHWPTLGLNLLKWAQKQGAVCGPAHSGWGIIPKSTDLPNYEIPPYDGIGANEYIVNVTHKVPGPNGDLVPAIDFMSTVDTPYVAELNMWYHTLNAGFRTRVSGETDFPCIFDDRVGLGRSYVKLKGEPDYRDWCEGIRQGRNYVGDGRSHFLEFTASAARSSSGAGSAQLVHMGESGSELKIPDPGMVRLNAKVAAYLPATLSDAIGEEAQFENRYWHIEKARIQGTRQVPVEVVVNGYSVATNKLVADGTVRDMSFDVNIDRSSWVTLRILPSSHTNPIWVMVGDKPVRASRRSIQWCLDGVDKCWSQKQRFIASAEMEDARKAYEHARETYRGLLKECEAD